jgi:hypothetical protein
MKLKQLLKDIDGVFIPPKKSYYLGKLRHGSPYFYPRNFVSSFIYLRRLRFKTPEQVEEYEKKYAHLVKYNDNYKFSNLPMVRRSFNKIFKLFSSYWYIEIGYPIRIHSNELGWKDKWDSPRYEWSPAFYIFFFKWQFCIWWNSPIEYNDKYYEQILWYICYSGKDIKKAKETWPWQSVPSKESTWDDKYLI